MADLLPTLGEPGDDDDPHSGSTSARKGVLDTADKLLKGLALFALLVTGLGYPAVIVQFVRRGIPSSFIDKELALRAGLLPAIGLLLLILVALFFVAIFRESKDAEMQEWVKSGAVSRAYTGTMLLLLAFGLSNAPIKAALAFVRDISRSPNFLSMIAVGAAWAFAVAVIVVVTILAIVIPARLGYISFHKRAEKRVDKLLRTVYLAPIRLFSVLPPFTLIVFSWILAGALFGAFGWWEQSVRGPVGPDWLVDNRPYRLLNSMILLSVATFFFALLMQRYGSDGTLSPSHPQELRLRSAAVFFAYLPLAALYSLVWYPGLPTAFGGGKPAQMTLWFDREEFPKFASKKLLHRPDSSL